MGEAVVKGQFVEVEVKALRRLKEPKGSCFAFADILIHGIKIRNLAVFQNKKEGTYFVKPPQQKGSNNKYYDLVNFGTAAESISKAVLTEFKS